MTTTNYPTAAARRVRNDVTPHKEWLLLETLEELLNEMRETSEDFASHELAIATVHCENAILWMKKDIDTKQHEVPPAAHCLHHGIGYDGRCLRCGAEP